MLKRLEIAGFKSFAKKTSLDFSSSVTAIVGPNGSGKSNVAEAFRFALGEQSMKSMRGKRSEDLIFSGTNAAPRSSRAAVAIVFDNAPHRGERQFKLDFDEIIIEREVFRDGVSEYSINGSKARLRDIAELLAGANIGETGHHIISQGEADRILIANPRERREMIEDALGLKMYEFKKQESEKKLLKTEENIKQVEALRREIAPHLHFLEKQVEKLERAESLQQELTRACQTYFAIEEAYLAREKEKTAAARRAAAEMRDAAAGELSAFEERVTRDSEGMKRVEASRAAERELERIVTERAALARDIGRVEGILEETKRRGMEVAKGPHVKILREDMTALRHEIEQRFVIGDTPAHDALLAAFRSIKSTLLAFFERYASWNDDYLAEDENAALRLTRERDIALAKDADLGAREEKARHALAHAREEVVAHEESGREGKRRLLELAEVKARQDSEVVRQNGRAAELALLEEELLRERAEALALAGPSVASYTPLSSPPAEERRVQEDRKRALERLKIRLEEAGGGGDEIRSEYKDASERETFLARELEDLAKSAAGLRTLIDDLDEELSRSFAEGLVKVNASFAEFFSLMFGGGGARLTLEEPEDEDPEESDDEGGSYGEEKKEGKPGIEISVNLPKKRIQSLMQLSGGERALTSIALIFAMSQVNPPPFLILDETDAALDEANSRRYGDMLESLSKHSQLIVITHNRETMSRANILYGVTMGADGISKLLSVKFDEALAVAK